MAVNTQFTRNTTLVLRWSLSLLFLVLISSAFGQRSITATTSANAICPGGSVTLSYTENNFSFGSVCSDPSRIDSILLINVTNEESDVLVCVQTVGTNQFFDHNETYSTAKKMNEALKSRSGMIFNVGDFGVDLDDMERKLSELCKSSFERVESRFYRAFGPAGRQPFWELIRESIVKNFNHSKKAKTSRLRAKAAIVGAYLIDFLPTLRTGFGLRKRKVFFAAKVNCDHACF